MEAIFTRVKEEKTRELLKELNPSFQLTCGKLPEKTDGDLEVYSYRATDNPDKVLGLVEALVFYDILDGVYAAGLKVTCRQDNMDFQSTARDILTTSITQLENGIKNEEGETKRISTFYFQVKTSTAKNIAKNAVKAVSAQVAPERKCDVWKDVNGDTANFTLDIK